MPNLQQRAVLDLAKDVRAYLRFEVGIIRGEVPGSAEVLSRPPNLLQEQLASRDREISRSLEASCSCRRFGGLLSTSAEPGTSPRMIPTSNLKYALTSLAKSNTARCCKFGIRYLPRVSAWISSLFFLVFVRIPYTTQSGSSQPGRPGRICGGDTILPFASAAGKPARRTAPEDVQGWPRNLWFAVHHAFLPYSPHICRPAGPGIRGSRLKELSSPK